MLEKNLNALMVIILTAVLWGALSIQLIVHEEPCPLCLLQRMGMLGMCFGALLNLRFGVRRTHYGLSLLAAAFGGFVALRHIALHACPGSPTFGIPFWGLSLYTWSALIHFIAIIYIAALMCLFDHQRDEIAKRPMNWWQQLAFGSTTLVALVNIFTTLQLCGLGDCEL